MNRNPVVALSHTLLLAKVQKQEHKLKDEKSRSRSSSDVQPRKKLPVAQTSAVLELSDATSATRGAKRVQAG
jgi:hypothetical protein